MKKFKHWDGFKWISGMFAVGGIFFVSYGLLNFQILTMEHILAVLLYFACALLAFNLYITGRFASAKGVKW